MDTGQPAHERRFRAKLTKSACVHFAYFDDAVSSESNRQPPSLEQVREILAFAVKLPKHANILIHCWAGISRSTAIGYAILCQAAGPGTEQACVVHLRKIRPKALPNSLIITLAELVLGRNGTLFAACEDLSMRQFSPRDDEF
jgi:predicted protein tyrosine phosphatase